MEQILTDIRDHPMYPDTQPEIRDFEIQHLSTNRKLQKEVHRRAQNDIDRVVVRMKGTIEDYEDLFSLAEYAIKMGYIRALWLRLSDKDGKTKKWWQGKRKEKGVHVRTRIMDYEIALEEWDEELFNYTPSPPLTLEEIMDSAAREFRDAFAGPGTIYAEVDSFVRISRNDWRRIWRKAGFEEPPSSFYRRPAKHEMQWGNDKVHPLYSFEEMDGDSDARIEFVDMEAWENVENYTNSQLNEVAEDAFGPVVTRVLAHAFGLFEPIHVLYWFFSHTYYKGRFPELVRRLSGTEEELGTNRFNAIRRDWQRKFDGMDDVLSQKLKEDPALRDVYEALF